MEYTTFDDILDDLEEQAFLAQMAEKNPKGFKKFVELYDGDSD